MILDNLGIVTGIISPYNEMGDLTLWALDNPQLGFTWKIFHANNIY